MGDGEFLPSYGGATDSKIVQELKYTGVLYDHETGRRLSGLYSQISVERYLIDFNMSKMYADEAEAASARVVGLLDGQIGKAPSAIGRYPKVLFKSYRSLRRRHLQLTLHPQPLGPEVVRLENWAIPYCPFKHDVYQLGVLMGLAFQPDVNEFT